VPDDNHAIEIEIVFPRYVTKVVNRVCRIEVCAGPSTSRLAYPSVLDIPRRDSLTLESIGHRAQVTRCRVSSLEAATVDENSYRMRACTRWNAQLSILARVFAVFDAAIRRETRKRSKLHGTQ
jgi:hypothetical protein